MPSISLYPSQRTEDLPVHLAKRPGKLVFSFFSLSYFHKDLLWLPEEDTGGTLFCTPKRVDFGFTVFRFVSVTTSSLPVT